MEFIQYEPIDPNTSVWDVGDMLEKGENLVTNYAKTTCEMRVYGCVIQYRYEGVWCGMALSLSNLIKTGSVLRKVVTDWKDTLDGTVEKGVWCLVSSDSRVEYIELIVAYHPTKCSKYTAAGISRDFNDKLLQTSFYKDAIPVPKTLSDELDKLFNIKRTQNSNTGVEDETSTNVDCYV